MRQAVLDEAHRAWYSYPIFYREGGHTHALALWCSFSEKRKPLSNQSYKCAHFKIEPSRQSKVEVYTIDPAALLWGRLFLSTYFLYV